MWSAFCVECFAVADEVLGAGGSRGVFQRLLEKAATVPGVRAASLVSALPLSGETWINLTSRENETRPMAEWPASNIRFISPEYFQTIHVNLRDGRTFEERDRKSKVAIISAKLAQRLWGSENPIAAS